jgi:hypothetical protein
VKLLQFTHLNIKLINPKFVNHRKTKVCQLAPR